MVRTDADGYAELTPEQIAYFKGRRGLQISTQDVQPSDVTQRGARAKKD